MWSNPYSKPDVKAIQSAKKRLACSMNTFEDKQVIPLKKKWAAEWNSQRERSSVVSD